MSSSSAQDEPWTNDAHYYEYSKASDPIGLRFMPEVPAERFSRSLYENEENEKNISSSVSRIIPLDLSKKLKTQFPATSPALLANFIRIKCGDSIDTHPIATSQLLYVIRGQGWSDLDVAEGDRMFWCEGDFITLPFSNKKATHHATSDTVMYWVHDQPLMSYLGCTPTQPRFRPTKYPRQAVLAELQRAAAEPEAKKRSRISVLLANKDNVQTLTITHVLWAMYGLLPAGQTQPPHRHQSVAVDLILDCQPGCYSLLGDEIDEKTGHIKDPIRVDWEPYSAFVTPPGMWHSHHNETDHDAHLIPIQDAGLQTYLRALDIQFTQVKSEADEAQHTLADISPQKIGTPNVCPHTTGSHA